MLPTISVHRYAFCGVGFSRAFLKDRLLTETLMNDEMNHLSENGDLYDSLSSQDFAFCLYDTRYIILSFTMLMLTAVSVRVFKHSPV